MQYYCRLFKNMKEKVVIITGASSGIGKSLAFEFGEKGAKVILAARNIEHLNETVVELKSRGIDAIAVHTDVGVETDCRKLIETTINAYGRIDVLINNAGISMRALFSELDLDVMHKLMNTNFWGTVYCTKFALPYLLKSKGSLVGVISVAGFIGLPARSGYSASKFAMRGFLDTIRIENRKSGLHVLVIAPGFTASNIRKTALLANGKPQGETPRNESKMMSSEAVAHHIYKGVIRRKRQIILTFFGGKVSVLLSKLWPALLEALIYKTMAHEANSPLK